jgi:protein-S-isoprenylcysteine O-methyltransferase Ste14
VRWAARLCWIPATLILGVAPSVLFFIWVEAMALDQGFAVMCAWIVGWPLVVLPGQPWSARVAFDLALMLGFGVLHSALAQLPVQEKISRVIGAGQVRAFYLIATGLSLLGVMASWQTLGGTFWEIVPHSLVADRVGLAAFSVLLVAACTVIAGPGMFEFLGIAPAWRGVPLGERAAGSAELVRSGMYRRLRHPGYALTIAAFLMANRMTYDRLVAVVGLLAYLLSFGIPLEERKLIALFGDAYRRYRDEVPALLPFGGRARS